jgi:hypothetical protein
MVFVVFSQLKKDRFRTITFSETPCFMGFSPKTSIFIITLKKRNFTGLIFRYVWKEKKGSTNR